MATAIRLHKTKDNSFFICRDIVYYNYSLTRVQSYTKKVETPKRIWNFHLFYSMIKVVWTKVVGLRFIWIKVVGLRIKAFTLIPFALIPFTLIPFNPYSTR